MPTILWDNDGVLVETEGLYFAACRTVLATVGVDLTPELYKEISLHRGQSTLELAAQRGVPPPTVECLRAERERIYLEAIRAHPCVIDGALETLRRLHGRARMGVVTSTRRQHFLALHERSGLLPYFDFVITHEDYRRSKPHPEPYLTALQRHGLDPQQCVAVEDSPRGVAAARAAGLRCLAVWNQWTHDGDLRGACRVLPSIRDVPDALLADGLLGGGPAAP